MPFQRINACRSCVGARSPTRIRAIFVIVEGVSNSVLLITLPCAAFALTILGYLFALRFFPRWGLLDFPERYGHTRGRLPYPTGIIGVLVFLIFFSFLSPPSLQMIGVVFAVALLGAISFIDDRTPLPFWLRLLTQVLIAALIFATGSRIYTITNPFDLFGESILKLDSIDLPGGPFGPLPLMSGIFTLGWLLLTMNALNWFDGIPGQVNALSVISFLMLGLLALSARVNQPELAMIAFILCAIAAASLLFDFPPGKVLLGDSGSMFFGLMLGLLGIYQGGKVATAFLALGVPLLDALFVIIRRSLAGKSPFRGDTDHLHHRLLKKGWSARQVVILTTCLGSAFGVTALFLSTNGKAVAGMLLFFCMLALTWYSGKRS